MGESDNTIMNEKTAEKVDHEARSDHLPIDRGWAWVVMVACFINMMLTIGYVRAYGIIFVEFIEVYKASASLTALIMGIQGVVISIVGFFSQNILMSILTVRKIVMIGGFTAAAGVILSYFANSIPLLIVTQSLLIGTGNAMVIGPGTVLLGQYFNKRRSIATAVAQTGANVGAIVVPILVRYCLDEFGLKGVFLIYGAVMLNIVVSGSLLRPLEAYKQRKPPASQLSKNQSAHAEDKIPGVTDRLIKDDELVSGDIRLRTLSESRWKNDLLPSQSQNVHSNHLNPSAEKAVLAYASAPDLVCVSLQDIHQESTDFGKKNGTTCRECCWNLFQLFDFSLFTNSLFWIIAGTAIFGIFAGAIMGIYIPALATSKDVDKYGAALVLSVSGATGALGRILVGFFADMGIIKINHILAFGLFCAGALGIMAPLYNGFWPMLVFSMLYGFFGGLYFSLIPVIIVDFLELQRLSKCFGFLQLFHGASLAASHPITGYFRDLTGNYDTSYIFLGAATFIAVILLMLEPLARRHENKKKVNQDVKPNVPEIIITAVQNDEEN